MLMLTTVTEARGLEIHKMLMHSEINSHLDPSDSSTVMPYCLADVYKCSQCSKSCKSQYALSTHTQMLSYISVE